MAGSSWCCRASTSIRPSTDSCSSVHSQFSSCSSDCPRSAGTRPTILPIRAVLYTLSDNSALLIGVQLLDGIGAGIFGALTPLVVADLTRGTGRYNLALGGVATMQGIGASTSGLVAGLIVVHFGYSTAFLTLGAGAAVALAALVFAMPETAPSLIGHQAVGHGRRDRARSWSSGCRRTWRDSGLGSHADTRAKSMKPRSTSVWTSSTRTRSPTSRPSKPRTTLALRPAGGGCAPRCPSSDAPVTIASNRSPDPRCEQQRRRRLAHLPLDLGRVVFLLGAVARERAQLVVA